MSSSYSSTPCPEGSFCVTRLNWLSSILHIHIISNFQGSSVRKASVAGRIFNTASRDALPEPPEPVGITRLHSSDHVMLYDTVGLKKRAWSTCMGHEKQPWSGWEQKSETLQVWERLDVYVDPALKLEGTPEKECEQSYRAESTPADSQRGPPPPERNWILRRTGISLEEDPEL